MSNILQTYNPAEFIVVPLDRLCERSKLFNTMEQSGIPANGGAALCGWCGVPLGSANTIRENVCLRCYRLLRDAGIADEEIFFDATADHCAYKLSPETTEDDAYPTEKLRHLQTSE